MAVLTQRSAPQNREGMKDFCGDCVMEIGGDGRLAVGVVLCFDQPQLVTVDGNNIAGLAAKMVVLSDAFAPASRRFSK
ncbi:hypothetical protein JZY06_11745 [Corynebacterium sp. CCM 8862]|uniref:Uncharacterized protein n=1 Tax=Corynebacterium mendelii TaxID=2765362 RepID=A0A939IYM4_9CORY|nr:hypothetical protein [Corynebacterium mendelii]